jgi:hypothetical protein
VSCGAPGAPSWLSEDDCRKHRDQIALAFEREDSIDEIPSIVRWIRPAEFFDVFDECLGPQGFDVDIDRVHSMIEAICPQEPIDDQLDYLFEEPE